MMTKSTATNKIAELRKQNGLNQQQLADLVGSHWITISKLERGKMRFSENWRKKIAAALKIDEWDLVPGGRALPKVHIEGYIDESGDILELDDDDDSETFALSTNFFTHPSYRWLLVSGDSLWPWFQDRDRICLWHLTEDEIESVIGRVCVVWFENASNKEDVAIGSLENGSGNGLYTVRRSGNWPLKDIRPISLAVVAMSVYYLGPESMKEDGDV